MHWKIRYIDLTNLQFYFFSLDEYGALRALPGVSSVDGVQYTFGQVVAKQTTWLAHNCDHSRIPHKCMHEYKQWCSSLDGSVVWARHQPSRGVVVYIDNPDYRAVPSSQFVSATLATYPPLLNRFLAAEFALGIRSADADAPQQGLDCISNESSVLDPPRPGDETLIWGTRLRGRQLRSASSKRN